MSGRARAVDGRNTVADARSHWHENIKEQRRQRAELPAPHLDQAAAIASVEQQAERQIAQVRERETQELSRLDKLIAAARELAAEVKEKATALARNVVERVESFFGTGKQAARAEGVVDRGQEQARAPSPLATEQFDKQLAALDQRLAFEASLPDRLADLDQRMDAQAKAREAQELSLKQQSLSQQLPGKEQENDHEEEHEIEHGYGLGIGR